MQNGTTDTVGSNTVTSVTRATAVVECLASGAPEYSLLEVAERTGLNKTTAHRLLRTLHSVGWVDRTAGGGYKLASQMVRIGFAVQRNETVWQIALPHLEKLASRAGATAFLMIPSDAGAVCMEAIDGGGPITINIVRPGSVLPYHASAGPRVLAAFRPDLSARVLDGEGRARYTPETIVDPASLAERLEQIRARGYDVTNSDLVDGTGAVSAPVFDHRRSIVAAVTLGDTSANIFNAELPTKIEWVTGVARAISTELGWSERPT